MEDLSTQLKRARERAIVLEALVRLAVDLVPPTVLHDTQAGSQLVAAIEKASVPAVRL